MKLSPEQQEPFDLFWAVWPRHYRKGAKAKCKARWRRDGLDAKADHIMAVLKLWKKKWLKDLNKYIPAPLVWLNGQRWDCELADLKEHEERMAEERREAPHSPIKPQMVQTDAQKDQAAATEMMDKASMAEKLEMVQWAIRKTGRESIGIGFFAAYLTRVKFDRERKA